MLFHTTYTSENRPGTVVVAMSPVTTGTSSAGTLRRSWSTIGCDSSIPRHGNASGGQRDRHPTRADRELQRATGTSQPGKEVHGWVKHVWCKHLG